MTVSGQRAANPTITEDASVTPSFSESKRTPKAKAARQRKPAAQPPSKQDRILAMLRRKEGTTVATVMKAIGWQNHSVHGFFAGVVRKKLGLNLLSEKSDGNRIYRIVNGKRVKAGRSNRKRAD